MSRFKEMTIEDATAALHRLDQAGFSMRGMAAELGSSLGMVHRFCKRHGVILSRHKAGNGSPMPKPRVTKLAPTKSKVDKWNDGQRASRLNDLRKPAKAPKADEDELKPLTTMGDRKQGQCCWPIGETDGNNTPMCGRNIDKGRSYCSTHRKRGTTLAAYSYG